jgi:hypothetical protein
MARNKMLVKRLLGRCLLGRLTKNWKDNSKMEIRELL